MLAQRACKRTAAQDRQEVEDELPMLGLYLPCAKARSVGDYGKRERGGGGTSYPRGRYANAPPHRADKSPSWWRQYCC